MRRHITNYLNLPEEIRKQVISNFDMLSANGTVKILDPKTMTQKKAIMFQANDDLYLIKLESIELEKELLAKHDEDEDEDMDGEQLSDYTDDDLEDDGDLD